MTFAKFLNIARDCIPKIVIKMNNNKNNNSA